MPSKRTYSHLIPVIAHSCLKPQPIQRECDFRGGVGSCHLANNVDSLCLRAPTMVPRLQFKHPYFGVTSSRPVNDKNNLLCLLIDIDYHFLNKNPDDPLLETRITRGRLPDAWQVSGQAK